MSLRFLTAGESHGPSLTAVLEGMPAGLSINVEIINKELRREWNSRIAEIEEAKAAYLAVCAKLGAIQRKAEEISNKLASGLEGFLPASGVPRLVTGIDLEGFAGAIFPDYNAIKKAFLMGGK